jgi:hypothetical protein
MIDGKYYLVEFDHFVGSYVEYVVRTLGVVHKKFAELDCPSCKSLSVSYFDALEGSCWSGWVCAEDNPKLIEVSEDEYNYILTSYLEVL